MDKGGAALLVALVGLAVAIVGVCFYLAYAITVWVS